MTAAQARQVALTRLLLADPDLAILDEATAAGSAHAGLLDRATDAAPCRAHRVGDRAQGFGDRAPGS
ncbi:MAG: hypothetical protein R2719_04500 [Micropruina sp.]|nr:hypothetical protein [Micropruina sp.]